MRVYTLAVELKATGTRVSGEIFCGERERNKKLQFFIDDIFKSPNIANTMRIKVGEETI